MAIITISRGTKSHGVELAHRLSEKLGYVRMSREVVLEGAKKYNIMAEELFEHLEESPSFWQKVTREHERYLIYVQCALIDAVKEDNVVYYGHAGQLFLRGIRHVLKVRLETPFHERVDAVMRESGMTFDKASDYIARIDEERVRWVKHIYGERWQDPSLYDLSFCIENLTIDSICEIISLAVSREEFRTSRESTGRLNDLSLECEVKAAFASDNKLWNLPLAVTAVNGVVTLRGTVKDQKTRNMFAELASRVKGVKECKVDIQLSTDPLHRGI